MEHGRIFHVEDGHVAGITGKAILVDQTDLFESQARIILDAVP